MKISPHQKSSIFHHWYVALSPNFLSSTLSGISSFSSLRQTTTFPCLLQADTVRIPSIPDPIYKRSFADIKFQIAQEDDLETNGVTATVFELVEKSDLVKGVYEGGFKTWECSIDLVQYLATKVRDEEIAGKKVLEVINLYHYTFITRFLKLPIETPSSVTCRTTKLFTHYYSTTLRFRYLTISSAAAPASRVSTS